MPKIVKVTPRKGPKRRKPLSKSPASAGGFGGGRKRGGGTGSGVAVAKGLAARKKRF